MARNWAISRIADVNLSPFVGLSLGLGRPHVLLVEPAMTFWITACAMATLVALLLGRAAWRGAKGVVPTQAQYDIRVYRDQLAEVDRDVARGVIAPVIGTSDLTFSGPMNSVGTPCNAFACAVRL